MTEEQKQEERELKLRIIQDLDKLREKLTDTRYSSVFTSDVRLPKYILNVIGDTSAHNLYELLAIKRFLVFLDKYEFDTAIFKRFCKFYEAIKFSGTHGRTRYKLTPVQVFQYANVYGFKDADGRRLCRQAYIFVPRKFSKTTSTAAMAVNELFFGDSNAQAYVGANSYSQAKICFDEIRNILMGIDPAGKHFKVNRELVMWKDNTRQSFCRCLAANPKTLDGLYASLVIMDEFSQARNTAGRNGADLKNTLTSSMGPRKEPLTVVITTASEVVDGPFAHELEGVKSVLRGEIDNDRVFGSLYMPDVDDAEDDPKTWAKVQPHLGITVQPDYYEEEYKNALLSAENMMVFRTKLLNIFAENEQKSWLTASLAKSISRHFSIDEYKGRHSMAAIDLSESDDFSAVTVGIYAPEKSAFFFHTSYFFPRGALDDHPNQRLYREWARRGYLTLTDGDVIDYKVIVDYVLEIGEKTNLRRIGYDSWKSLEVINMLAASGNAGALTPVGQTYGNFTAPVQSFEHGCKTGHIFINDNPINAFCFGNAILDYDNLENCKPIKRAHNMKIDGLITKLMAMRLFMDEKR